MTIDLVVAGIVAFAALLGLWSGAIRQLAHLGGLIAGYLAARPLAALVAPEVTARFHTPPLFTSIACSFALFFVVYVVAVLLLRFVLARILPDGESGMLNRFGGFLLGGAKAALMVFVLLSAVVLAEKTVQKHWPAFRREARASIALQLARQHNLFASVPQFSGLERIVKSTQDPESAARLAEDPEFKALARDPRMKSLADDAAVQRAFQTGDYASLLSSAKVLDLLNDPKVSQRLLRLASGESAPAEDPAPARPAPTAPAKPRRTGPRGGGER